MNRTWSEAVSLVKANFQLLAIIAGVFMLLPGLIVYAANPDLVALLTGANDPAASERMLTEFPPRLYLWGLASFLVQMIGYGAMIALMGADRPTVGQAIARGAKSLPSIVGAFIVFVIGLLIVGLLLSVVLGFVVALVAGLLGLVAGEGLRTDGTGMAGAGVIIALVYAATILLELYVFVRFMMTLPVIVVEREYNPFKALARAWVLSRTRTWAMMGFIALLAVAYLVILVVLMLVIGGLGLAAGGTVTAGSALGIGLLLSILGVFVAMLGSGILTSIHRQLSGAGPAVSNGPAG